MDLGPSDPSLLTLPSRHRSGPIWAGQDMAELHCRRRQAVMQRTFPLDDRIFPHLQRAGFYGVARIGYIELDWHLITTLIERWRQETHTFHLAVGEATITLQDVEIQLGLPVDGLPVSGSTELDYDALCFELLGFVPEAHERQGGRLKLSILADRVHLREDATELQIERYARAYILQLIGGFLFSDQSNNLVHLVYLPLLTDFDRAGEYSWGSATLAWLFCHMCHGVDYEKKGVSGAFILLQLWACDRFPFLAPHRADHVHNDPYAHLPIPPPLRYRWRNALLTTQVPMHVLIKYREMLDMQSTDQVIWMPYTEDVINALPGYCQCGKDIWRTISPLICFAIVELHRPDRVLRQFGMYQTILEQCNTRVDLHDTDFRGQADCDWLAHHRNYVEQWEERVQNLAEGVLYEGEGAPNSSYYDPYMVWYRTITRRFMTINGATFHFLASQLAQVHILSQNLDDASMQEIKRVAKSALESVHAEYMIQGGGREHTPTTYDAATPSTGVIPLQSFTTTPHEETLLYPNMSVDHDPSGATFQAEHVLGDESLSPAARADELNWLRRGKRGNRQRRGEFRSTTETHPPTQPPLQQYTRVHLRRNKRRHWPLCGTE